MSKNFKAAAGMLLFMMAIDFAFLLFTGDSAGAIAVVGGTTIYLLVCIMDKIDELKELTHEQR